MTLSDSCSKDASSNGSRGDFYYYCYYEKSLLFRKLFTKILLWDILNNDDEKREKSNMLSLLKLFQSIPKKILLLIVIGMSITALDGIVIPYFISNLIEVGTSKNVSDLILISIVGILGYGFVRFGVFIWDEFQQRLLKLLSIQTKEKLITNYYEGDFEQSEVESILLTEWNVIQQQGIVSFISFVYCLTFSFVTFIYIALLDLKMTIIFLAFAILPLLIPHLFTKKIKVKAQEWSQNNQQYIARQHEFIDYKRVIKNFRVESIAISNLGSKIRATEEDYYQMNHLRFLSKILANLVSGISSFLPLAIGVYFSIQGDLKLSVVMAIYLASDRIISPLLNAMDYYQKINTTIPMVQRMNKYLEFEPLKEEEVLVTDVFPIQLTNIHLEVKEHTILNELHFMMNKGDRILLMGPSGSGKTTLLDCIYGEIHPQVGKIRFAGVEASETNNTFQKAKIGYFMQETNIFMNSIAFNLTLGEEYSVEQMENVLKEVHLSYLLERYDLMDETVNLVDNLSGGEKARLCLARLLLRSYEMLLIDEFSSAVDEETTTFIRDLLKERQMSFIEISHRMPKHPEDYHKIYVLEDGKLSIK